VVAWSTRSESFKDSANLPDPDMLALKITEDLEAALAQFAEIAADLKVKVIQDRATNAFP
jgi:type I restriction enzyme M protein